MRPELQAQDVAFPREQVVADVQPAPSSRRWQRTMRSAMKAAIAAVSLPPCSMSCSAAVRIFSRASLVRRAVPLGDLGVEVPAVVVEPRRVGDGADVGERLAARARGSRRRRRRPGRRCRRCSSGSRPSRPWNRSSRPKASPSRRVPQVADVRRLVRIDGRVLDDGLARTARRERPRPASGSQPRLQPVGAIQEEVEVAVGRGLDARDAVDRPERAGQLLGDGARRLAQPAGERERDRHGDVAERAPWRHFERHVGDRRIVRRPGRTGGRRSRQRGRERADGRAESQIIP